jgi:hypothetical protein
MYVIPSSYLILLHLFFLFLVLFVASNFESPNPKRKSVGALTQEVPKKEIHSRFDAPTHTQVAKSRDSRTNCKLLNPMNFVKIRSKKRCRAVSHFYCLFWIKSSQKLLRRKKVPPNGTQKIIHFSHFCKRNLATL